MIQDMYNIAKEQIYNPTISYLRSERFHEHLKHTRDMSVPIACGSLIVLTALWMHYLFFVAPTKADCERIARKAVAEIVHEINTDRQMGIEQTFKTTIFH